MLGALYLAAWQASAMADKDAQDFIKYDQESKPTPNPMEENRRGGTPPAAPAAPTTSPSAPAANP